MNQRFSIATAAAIVALASVLAHAEPPAASGGLHLTLPAGWSQQVNPAANGKPASVSVVAPGDDGPLKMKIQLLPLPHEDLDSGAVTAIVDKMIARAKTVSADTDIVRHDIAGNFNGYYFTVTPKNQQGPAEQRYVATTAFLHAPDVGMAVSMSHRKDSKDLATAIALLRDATVQGKTPATRPAP